MAQSFKNLRSLMGIPGRGVLAFTLLVLVFLVASQVHDIRYFPYDAGTYWLLATDPQRLPHQEIIRGYFLALLLGLPVRALAAIGVDPIQAFRWISSVLCAFILGVQLPLVFTRLFGGSATLLRSVALGLLVVLIFPGQLVYPLSDLPALALLWGAIHFAAPRDADGCANSSMPLLRMFGCGLALAAAYNTRSIYLLPAFGLGLYVLFAYWRSPRVLLLFLAGALLITAPQVVINHRLHGNYSADPAVAAGNLFARQLDWGVTVQKYETDISSTAFAGVEYADPAGAALLARFPAGRVSGIGEYVRYVFRFPVEFLGLFGRHLANGLDVRDGLGYTTTPPAQRRLLSLVNLAALLLAAIATRLALTRPADTRPGLAGQARRPEPRLGRNAFFIAVLLSPVLMVIPGAVETRFFLPLHVLAYVVLTTQLDYRQAKTGFAREGAWWIVFSAIFLLFYFGITESTIANARASWAVP